MSTLDNILWWILGLAVVIGRLVCLPFLAAYVIGICVVSIYQLWDAGLLTKDTAKEAGLSGGDWGALLVRAVSEIRTGEFNAEPTAANFRARAMQLAAQERFKKAAE